MFLNLHRAIEQIGGLELESDYPYKAKGGQCHFNKTLSRVKVTGAIDLPKNETAMALWLVENGPLSIGTILFYFIQLCFECFQYHIIR